MSMSLEYNYRYLRIQRTEEMYLIYRNICIYVCMCVCMYVYTCVVTYV